MRKELGQGTSLTDNIMPDDSNMCTGTNEKRKYSREADVDNRYMCFVREAALRVFAADLRKILASDAVKCAEELADALLLPTMDRVVPYASHCRSKG